MHAEVLNVLYLKESIYSRDYLARQLLAIIDDYGISKAIHHNVCQTKEIIKDIISIENCVRCLCYTLLYAN
jgi:hypothetical protein